MRELKERDLGQKKTPEAYTFEVFMMIGVTRLELAASTSLK